MPEFIDWPVVASGWVKLLGLALPLGMGLWKRVRPQVAIMPPAAMARVAGVMTLLATLAWLWAYALTLLPDPADGMSVQGLALLADTQLGRRALVHATLCSIAALILVPMARRIDDTRVLLVLAVALASHVMLGHVVAVNGLFGWAQLALLAVHVLLAAFWLGAIASLWWQSLHAMDGADLGAAMRAFGPPGIATVVTLLGSGAAVAWWRADFDAWRLAMGAWITAPQTSYAGVLVFKVLVFALMCACAGFHRQCLVPRLLTGTRGWAAVRVARGSLALEYVLGLSVLVAAVALGGLSPPT